VAEELGGANLPTEITADIHWSSNDRQLKKPNPSFFVCLLQRWLNFEKWPLDIARAKRDVADGDAVCQIYEHWIR
jgi:hypothetical protein